MVWRYRSRTRTHLLHLGGSALEQLDIARADALFVLGQRLVRLLFRREQDERVARRPPVRMAYEQNAFFSIENVRQYLAATVELQLLTENSVSAERHRCDASGALGAKRGARLLLFDTRTSL